MAERHRQAAAFVHFDRNELGRLLALYAGRVADGEWRDYAIDQTAGRAVFAVFRHTLEKPLFTITKRTGMSGRAAGWEVANGIRTLLQADTLDEALTLFDRELRLVPH
jgi:hypothetical protein